MSKKLRRKDLKGPDEFVSTTQRIIAHAREHSGQVTWLAGGAVIVLGLALGVRAYRESRQEAAEAAFGVAYRAFAKEDFARAADLFDRVHADWAGTPQAKLALAYAGNANAEAGNVEAARRSFEELLELTSKDPALQQLALYNLGALERQRGDASKAEERFRAAATIEGPFAGAAWVAAFSATNKTVTADDVIPPGVSEGVQEYLEAQRQPRAAS